MKRRFVWYIEYQIFDRENGFPFLFFPSTRIKSHLSNTDENRERVIKNFKRNYRRHNPDRNIRVLSARCLGEVDELGNWVIGKQTE